MTDRMPDSLSILGVGVNVFESYEHAVRVVGRRISLGQRTLCVAVNPEKVHRAARDTKLLSFLDSADVKICDGVGVSVAARMLYGRKVPRCTGVDLFMHVAQLAAAERWKVFLLGATPASNEKASEALLRKFPGLVLAGRRHGYFDDSDAVVDEINASGARLLFVALGSPRQEYWIGDNAPRLRPAFVMGVGGSLDILSGSATRAPETFCRFGAEWLFRLVSQPARAGRQRALPSFAFQVIKSAMLNRRVRLKR